MEIIQEPIDVEVLDNSIDVQTNDIHSVCIEDNNDLDITVQKKEFVITGDDIFISGSGQETPAWITEMINDQVISLVSSKTTELNDAISSINQALLELEVARNAYTEAIMTEETIDGIVVSHLSTLNATVQDNSANIINLETTKATPDEALTLSISHMNSEIQDGAIHSLVTDINTTIANDRETAATSVSSLGSTFNDNASTVETILTSQSDEYGTESNAITELRSAIDLENGVSGTATAVDKLNTFVGYEKGDLSEPSLADQLSAIESQVDGKIELFQYNHGPVGISEPIADTMPNYNIPAVDKDGNAVEQIFGAFKVSLFFDGVSAPANSVDQYTMTMDLNGQSRTGYLNGNYVPGTLCVMKVYVEGSLNGTIEWDLGFVSSETAVPANTSIIMDFEDLDPSNFVASTVPLPHREPYATWLDTDTANGDTVQRELHTGDTFIYTNSLGQYVHSFKFIQSSADPVDETKTDADGFGWYEIKDDAAMIAANRAYGLADGKMAIWYVAGAEWYNVPSAEVGDLLFRTDSDNEAYTANIDAPSDESNWTSLRDEGLVNDIADAAHTANDAIARADGVVNALYQNDEPLSGSYGDWWVDTDDGEAYRYEDPTGGSEGILSWVNHSTSTLGKAYLAAKEAKGVADGKMAVWYKDSFDSTNVIAWGDDANKVEEGDILFLTTDVGSYKSGTSWRALSDNPAETSGWSSLEDGSLLDMINKIVDGTTDMSGILIGEQDIGQYVTGAVNTGTDNMIHVFSGTTLPGSVDLSNYSNGDLYIHTDDTDVVTTYRYDGVSLIEIEGSSNIKKLADLTDGKRTIYTTVGMPSDSDATGDLVISINDLWIPPADVTIGGTTYGEGEIYRCTQDTRNGGIEFNYATKYHDLIEDLNEELTGLVDGKLQTFVQDTLPYANEIGIIDSATIVELDKKINDLWLCTSDIGTYTKGKYYQYEKTEPSAGVYSYTWTEAGDITSSLSELVNQKRTIFSGNTTVGAINDDLWIPSEDVTGALLGGGDVLANEIYIYKNGWVLATNYTEDLVALRTGIGDGTILINLGNVKVGDEETTLVDYVADQIDKEVVVYSGTSHALQTGMKADDIFIEKTTEVSASGITVDVINTYKYNGTSWDAISSNDNLTALADLTDGKRTIYGDADEPTIDAYPNLKSYDMWIPGTGNITHIVGELYVWDGNSWEVATKYTAEIETAQQDASDAKEDAEEALSTLTDIADDNLLTPGEKPSVIREYDILIAEEAGIVAKAVDYAITTEKTAYETAVDTLTTYLSGLVDPVAWDSVTGNTTIVAATFRSKFSDVYSARQTLLNTIYSEAKQLSVDIVDSLANGTAVISLDGTTTLVDYVADQIDKSITMYSGNVDPWTFEFPSLSDGETSALVKNDLYTKYASGTTYNGVGYSDAIVYKYDGGTINLSENWSEESAGLSALADLSDGKRTLYANASHDVPTGVANDVWIPTTGDDDGTYVPGEIYQFTTTQSTGKWELATKYSENLDTFIGEVEPKLTTLKNQVDGKVEYYFYDNSTDNPLSTISAGWGDAEHGNVVYYTGSMEGHWYNSTATTFVPLEDTSMLQALQNAAEAQETADGKITSYYGTLAERDVESGTWTDTEKVNNMGDIWVTTDSDPADLQYRWSGSSWELISAGVVSLSEKITKLDAYILPVGYTVALKIEDSSYVEDLDINGNKQYGIPKDNNTVLMPDPLPVSGADYVVGDWIPQYEGALQLASELGGIIGGMSLLEDSIRTTADGVEAKFEYGSTIVANGKSYDSGFGLKSTVATGGTDGDGNALYDSEFWINAEKFRFTNNSGDDLANGDVFIIDGNSVKFNGTVEFGEINGIPTHTSGSGSPSGVVVEGSTYVDIDDDSFWSYTDGSWVQGGNPDALTAEDIGPIGTTTINGSLITTGTIAASGLDIYTVPSNYTGTIMDQNGIRVYDSGVCRVKLGNIL